MRKLRTAKQRKRYQLEVKMGLVKPIKKVDGKEKWLKRVKSMPYRQYLKTKHWRLVRKLALEYHGAVCKKCGETKGLNVHHKTYERIGQEDVKQDFEILCWDCHHKWHQEEYEIRMELKAQDEEGRA